MKELKDKIDKIFYVLKKIDINITNSASTSVDKIIDIIHTAAITASNLVIDTAAITASNTETIFDNNMYIKCLIHEIRTPINNIILGINSIENNIK